MRETKRKKLPKDEGRRRHERDESQETRRETQDKTKQDSAKQSKSNKTRQVKLDKARRSTQDLWDLKRNEGLDAMDDWNGQETRDERRETRDNWLGARSKKRETTRRRFKKQG